MVRRAWPLAGAVFATLALGCGQARHASGALTASSDQVAICTRCHGDPSRAPAADPLAAAAPPRSVRGGEGPGDPGVGAHQLHLSDGPFWRAVPCSTCHRLPTDAAAHPAQEQGRLTFSGLAAATWIGSPAIQPGWNGASCSATYCHGAFPGGDAANAPVWTAARADACGTCHALPPPSPHPVVASDVATCRTCHPDPSSAGLHLDGKVDLLRHDAPWMDPASPGFHAAYANRGIIGCQRCHGIDLSGGFAGVACASCHDGGIHGGMTVVPFQAGGATNCVACHGGIDNQSGAPPRATWGRSGDPVRVGAHSSHVAAGYDCSVCHPKPTDMLSPGHIDGDTATVTFGGLGLAGSASPVWNRGTARCSGTYCHGSTLSGGSNTAPDWTRVGQGQAACGTCHGLPPAAPHLAVASDLGTCLRCHPDPLSGATHVNGQVDLVRHEAAWMDLGSPGFHASLPGGVASCQLCHGADLSGSFTGVSCASCHDGGVHGGVTVVAFQVGGATSCVACHGGTDNQSGAPPRATWGRSGDPVAVGAHSTHVAAGYDCDACHLKPTDIFSPGHVDGPDAEVVFGGLALTGPSTPTWDHGTATCSSTYCHGSTLAGGSNPAPVWTRVGQGQAACGACHGLPPATFPSLAHPRYGFAAPCLGCHPATASRDAGGNDVLVAGGPHLNGSAEFTFAGHPPGWAVPGTNGTVGGLHSDQQCMGCSVGGISMSDYYGNCTQCHGQAGNFSPAGGSSRVSCGACHPAFFNADGTTSCNFCH